MRQDDQQRSRLLANSLPCLPVSGCASWEFARHTLRNEFSSAPVCTGDAIPRRPTTADSIVARLIVYPRLSPAAAKRRVIEIRLRRITPMTVTGSAFTRIARPRILARAVAPLPHDPTG